MQLKLLLHACLPQLHLPPHQQVFFTLDVCCLVGVCTKILKYTVALFMLIKFNSTLCAGCIIIHFGLS